ncbi:hypothetical protein AYL99_05941 [Fonsecaea erecta]|uniref:Vacuolar ATPase assembly protein VMA22 n=1 Tax=Fonsecaea erecta TaxID=1367422 RepID=A0A178ZM95_9EURO|nr:hypothetical protein AYL99_05941 [Fonsecaea erecta]OAP60939.1 hypothetical protein AYL99_05941 [Fonsecaea erecta]
MVSHLPSPPSSRPSSPDSNSGTQPQLVEAHTPDCGTQVEPEHQSKGQESSDGLLSDRLDALLVSYLNLLDTYTTLRDRLSKDLSGGFFALAQANRNAQSTLGVGRRYGEEGFDERMKAGKVVKIEKTRNAMVLESYKGKGHKEVHEDVAQTPAQRTASQRNKEEMESGKYDLEEDIEQSASTPYDFSVSSTSNLTKDPLKWYGILIPPALRTCQTHFATSISSTIPEILNTASAMRSLEEEIWIVRRQLGTVDNYATANVDRLGNKDDGNIESDTTASKMAGGRNSESPLSSRAMSSPKFQTSHVKRSSSLLSTTPPAGNLRTESCSSLLKLG